VNAPLPIRTRALGSAMNERWTCDRGIALPLVEHGVEDAVILGERMGIVGFARDLELSGRTRD
jgi:hypothetical protein